MKKTIVSLRWQVSLGTLDLFASGALILAYDVTTLDHSGITKHASILYWKPYITDKIVRYFGEVVRVLGSTTLAGIKIYQKMILHGIGLL